MAQDNEVAGMVVSLAMEDGSFQDSITNLNRQMRVVDSEFKNATGNASNYGDSIEGLQASINKLNRFTEIQSKLIEKYQERLDASRQSLERNVQAQAELQSRIEGTRRAYEESIESVGADAEATQSLRQELEQLEASYEGNNNRIRNNVRAVDNHTIALNNAQARLASFERQTNETQDALDNFGQSMESVNGSSDSSIFSIGAMQVAMGNLVSKGIEMAVEALKALVAETLEYAKGLNKLSEQTGMHTDELQQWDEVLRQTGSSILEADGDMAMLAERINEASMGTGEGLEVWNQLGISVEGAGGKLKSQGEVLTETVIALQNVEDATKRNALASQLLGTTGENLMPILNKTNAELQAIKGNAKVISEEDINAVNNFSTSWDNFVNGSGKEIMGILADVATLLTPIVKLIDAIITPLLGLLGDITEIIVEPFRVISGEIEDTTSTVASGAETSSKAIKGTYEEVESSGKASMNGLKKATTDVFETMTTAFENFKSKEMSKYEEQLRKQYGSDSLANEKAIQKKLKAHEDYLNSKLEKDKKYEEDRSQMESRYRKVYSKQGGVNTISYEPIRSYATGTKYHPGGLAYVHKDELLNLPEGTQVNNKLETQQVLRGTGSEARNNFYGDISVKADNPKQFMDELQTFIRRGGR